MTESVAHFAQSLKIPVQVLLDQLARAGVSIKTADSQLTLSDKQRLLDHLRATRGSPPARPTRKSNIQRLIDTGYLTKKALRGLKNEKDVTEPQILNSLARHAVHAAYSDCNVKFAQALIEVLPRQFQQSLTEWFGRLGMPCTRLAYPLDALPNSLWMISPPSNRKLQSAVFKLMAKCPVTLIERDPKYSQVSDKPNFDDREIDEHGRSVRAFQGGATGLKR